MIGIWLEEKPTIRCEHSISVLVSYVARQQRGTSSYAHHASSVHIQILCLVGRGETGVRFFTRLGTRLTRERVHGHDSVQGVRDGYLIKASGAGLVAIGSDVVGIYNIIVICSSALPSTARGQTSGPCTTSPLSAINASASALLSV